MRRRSCGSWTVTCFSIRPRITPANSLESTLLGEPPGPSLSPSTPSSGSAMLARSNIDWVSPMAAKKPRDSAPYLALVRSVVMSPLLLTLTSGASVSSLIARPRVSAART